MQLTIHDVANFLKVSERTLYRWIKQGAIPVYQINGQYRFNRAELLEWTTAKKINVSSEILQEAEMASSPLPGLTEVLHKGGIYYRVEGDNQESVFKSLINILRLPEQIDANLLLEILLARESLASTGIGDGIAIPHARNPIILNIPYSMLGLFFLEKPIDFRAIDDKPVHILFLLISQTARHHLNLLSRLAFALRDSKLKESIISAASREVILNEFQRIEKEMSTTFKDK